MSNESEPGDGRLAESADMIVDPDPDDPADLAGAAAEETVDHLHDEVDQLAADADPTGTGQDSEQG